MQLFFENLKIALSALWLNKIRATLTILGVVIGVFAVIMIVSITSGLKDEITGLVSSLGSDILAIEPFEAPEKGPFGMGGGMALSSFSEKEAKILEEKTKDFLPLQTKIYELAGKIEYGNKKVRGFIYGADPDWFLIRQRKVVAGRPYDNLDEKLKKKVGVLEYKGAQELFGKIEKAVGQIVNINGKKIKIIGVLEKEEFGFGSFDLDKDIHIPASAMKELFENAKISEVFVKAENEEAVPKVKIKLEQIMKEIRPNADYSILTQETIMTLVNQISSLITTALAGLASISLIVGGIGIMNIMLVSVSERTREIGIRKAVGATNFNILTQFLTEAIILCLVGGVIGLLLASGISVLLTRYINLPTLISWQTIVGAFSFSIIVGVGFGIAPAIRAASKDPIEALHYE